MAFDQTFRKHTVDFLREYIGDDDKIMYSDAQLDSFLRSRVFPAVMTEQLRCYKWHYYSLNPGPVLDLDITAGTDGAHYLIDENSKHIEWTSGSAEPADNDSIEISYVDLNFFGTVRDVLLQIATDRAKLAVRARAEGIENDLTGLRAELMRQIADLGAIEYWGP